MDNGNKSSRILEYAIFIVVMYFGLQLAILLGVQEKSWFQRSWEFVTGGSLGILAGIGFFFICGSIGWVCGPLYGALGLFGLSTLGALGGLGIGAIVNIIRDPVRFNFTWSIIIPVIIIGYFFAKSISKNIVQKLTIYKIEHTEKTEI